MGSPPLGSFVNGVHALTGSSRSTVSLRLRLAGLAATLAISLVGTSAAAQPAIGKRAAIVARALSYDRSLGERAGDTVVLLVLHKAGNEASVAAAKAWVEAFGSLEGTVVHGLPFKVVSAPWDPVAVKAQVESAGVDALLACDGLEGDVAAIKSLARERHVLSAGSTRAFAEQGLSLAVVAEGDRSVIVVNLPASKAEGVAFSSDLLRLAKIVE